MHILDNLELVWTRAAGLIFPTAFFPEIPGTQDLLLSGLYLQTQLKAAREQALGSLHCSPQQASPLKGEDRLFFLPDLTILQSPVSGPIPPCHLREPRPQPAKGRMWKSRSAGKAALTSQRRQLFQRLVSYTSDVSVVTQ